MLKGFAHASYCAAARLSPHSTASTPVLRVAQGLPRGLAEVLIVKTCPRKLAGLCPEL